MIQAHSGTPSQLELGCIFQLCGEESGKRANSRSFFSFFTPFSPSINLTTTNRRLIKTMRMMSLRRVGVE